MARVVCPSCKAAFEAGISREDYVLNCSACGVAFNAAQYLPDSEFRAICDRRPGAGTKLSYDRGTRAAGNVIRTVNTDSGTRSAINPDTRTGGLPFDDSSESFRAPKPVPAPTAAPADPFGARAAARFVRYRAQQAEPTKYETVETVALDAAPPEPAAAPDKRNGSDAPLTRPKSFLEASVTTARFRALKSEAIEPSKPSTRMALTTGTHPAVDAPPPKPAPAPVPVIADPEVPAPPPSSAQMNPLAAFEAVAAGLSAPAPAPAAVPAKESQRGKRPPLLEGRFGPYEIECEIARGGVGAVFKANEPKAGRQVALKVLLDGEDADEVECERFRRECETAKALALPGMIEIYDVGEIDGKPFMAMELVEGKSLDRLIRDGGLAVHEGLLLMQSVADTVGRLHEAGYVHRDLKPGNILLDRYGTPKVADFGLVKSLDEVTRLTASGLVCGTPAYMAPEQAKGDSKAIDPCTDVWALGAVMYELFTGQAPFHADNALRLMLKITKEAPKRPGLLNPKVPRDVESIVMKCLEKNRERRYPNGRALAEDLNRFLAGQPVEAARGQNVTQFFRVVHEHRKVAAIAGVGLAALLLVGVLVRVALAPQEAGSLTEDGWKALREQRLGEAEAAFRRALDLDASQAQASLGLAHILGSRSVDRNQRKIKDGPGFNEALGLAVRAAELAPELRAEAATQRGQLYMFAGRYADEVREREVAVALRSDSPHYYQALGLAYWNVGFQTGNREYYMKAQQAFRTVLSLQQDYPQTRAYMKRLQEQFLVQPTLPIRMPAARVSAAPQ